MREFMKLVEGFGGTYTEIEFVCINPVKGGSDPVKIKTLYQILAAMPGLILMRQDFMEEAGHLALVAIIVEDMMISKRDVIEAAKKAGVEIDTTRKIGDLILDQIYDGSYPDMIDMLATSTGVTRKGGSWRDHYALTEATYGTNPLARFRDKFLGDEYIDAVLAADRWSSHGSNLDGFVNEFCPDDSEGAIRAALREWLPKRLDYVERDLMRLSGETVINRIIGVDRATFVQMQRGETLQLGVFWGAGEFEPQNTNPIMVDFSSTLNGVTVDWAATIESRIDFDHGDHEQEFQLVPGTPVAVTQIAAWDVSEPSTEIPVDGLSALTFVA